MLVHASCASITCLALEKEEVEKDVRPEVKTKSAVGDVKNCDEVEKVVTEVLRDCPSNIETSTINVASVQMYNATSSMSTFKKTF